MNDSSTIDVEFLPHAELHYHILSRLDLGKDAANLYRDERRKPDWADELVAAYRAASGRLVLQVLPLWADDLEQELEMLRSGTLTRLDDDAGRNLSERFADCLEEQRPKLRHCTPESPRWLDTLSDCRLHLWSRLEQQCPPLRIVDVPSLATATGAWTHGRATGRTERTVAVSLEHEIAAFLQTLHEEIHPVTDPVIRQQHRSVSRDTRAGTPGFELHYQLEQMAIDVGQALVEARAPQFADDYRRWKARFR